MRFLMKEVGTIRLLNLKHLMMSRRQASKVSAYRVCQEQNNKMCGGMSNLSYLQLRGLRRLDLRQITLWIPTG
jgi:hypothetical protein